MPLMIVGTARLVYVVRYTRRELRELNEPAPPEPPVAIDAYPQAERPRLADYQLVRYLPYGQAVPTVDADDWRHILERAYALTRRAPASPCRTHQALQERRTAILLQLRGFGPLPKRRAQRPL